MDGDDAEFGSGDDLFDSVDVDDLLAPPQKRKHPDLDDAASKRQKSDASLVALARRILTDTFGHASFHHQQEAAIARVMAGHNTLVVFPTGAGKSLCYQIPAVAFEELDADDVDRSDAQPGITIVVSPLLALIKDQLDALRSRGISAASIDSSNTHDQLQLTRCALKKGQIRLLYCAPERLSNESFIETIKTVPGGVRLIAVDEAHCISEWGHSFRPEYLKVARFAQEINAERVVCLTATATPKVVDDVCKAFSVDSSCVFRTPPYRPNLRLYAEPVDKKHDKFLKIFDFLRSHPGPTLIYVTLQAQAESLARDLKKQGFRAEGFHAGMKAQVKLRIQDDFMASKIPIVCATIAFGMGINKQDIRNIIHWDIPATVEEYTQQIGRAGRDGKESHCMLYICHEDFYLRENFARGDLPSRRSLKALLEDIFDADAVLLPVGEVINANHNAQSRNFDIRLSPLSIIYASLELRFGLIRAITPEYTTYSFEDTGTYDVSLKADRSEEAKAIASHARKAAKYYHVDVSAVAREAGIVRADIIRKLNQLEERDCIRLKASGLEHRYRILQPIPSTDGAVEQLVDQLYADLEFREQEALGRLQQMAGLITGTKCFALALAQHFGMKLPDGKESCGHCTFCLSGRPIVLPPVTPKKVDKATIACVLGACDVRDDPRFLARIAFGIKSPRVTQMKLDRSAVFRCLAHHDFKALLREFTAACEAAGPDSTR